MHPRLASDAARLRLVKLIHTGAWAFFACAILLIPVTVWLQRWSSAVVLIGLVFAECLAVALGGMKCPLTPIAARYTADRTDNFDIYLPLWLARYNKQIFGTLYLAGCLFAAVRWLGR